VAFDLEELNTEKIGEKRIGRLELSVYFFDKSKPMIPSHPMYVMISEWRHLKMQVTDLLRLSFMWIHTLLSLTDFQWLISIWPLIHKSTF
jgi:hypothetical protein